MRAFSIFIVLIVLQHLWHTKIIEMHIYLILSRNSTNLFSIISMFQNRAHLIVNS